MAFFGLFKLKHLVAVFLLEEGRVQSALSSFSEVIQQDADNVRAYNGVAKCFERLGRFQNELEIWNIINSILQRQRGSTLGRTSLDFDEKLIRKLFPCKQMELVEALVTLARKCFKMAEYQDSAEKFLDAIALVSAGCTRSLLSNPTFRVGREKRGGPPKNFFDFFFQYLDS